MTTIDKSGTSIEDIISAFRKEHNIQDWELKYEILKKPSNGIFGLPASRHHGQSKAIYPKPAWQDGGGL